MSGDFTWLPVSTSGKLWSSSFRGSRAELTLEHEGDLPRPSTSLDATHRAVPWEVKFPAVRTDGKQRTFLVIVVSCRCGRHGGYVHTEAKVVSSSTGDVFERLACGVICVCFSSHTHPWMAWDQRFVQSSQESQSVSHLKRSS